jgi:nitrogen regulatory protein PII
VPPISAKVITIITAFEARDLVLDAFADLGVRKYSVLHVEGLGAHGERRSGLTETKNLMYIVVASEALAARLLQWVERELLLAASSIAYSADAAAVAALPIR